MIGELLKNEREQKGLTLKDVERETSIRSAYIDAIEREDFGALPGEVYARGFVRNYANFLRLDSDEVVSQFRIDYNQVVRGVAPDEVPSKSSVSRIFRKKKSHDEQPTEKTQEPPIPSITTIPILTSTPEEISEQTSESTHAKTSEPTYNESFSKPVLKASAKVEPIQESAPEPIQESIPESVPTVQDIYDGKLPTSETESVPAEEISFNEEVAKQISEEVDEPTIVAKSSKFDEHDMTLPNDQIRIEVDKESSWQKPALVAAILAIAAGAGYFIMNSDASNLLASNEPKVESKIETNREEKIQSKTASEDVDEELSKISHNPITSTAQANPKEVEVRAKFSDDCWISVVADGKEIYEGIASSGDNMSWKADQKIVVTVGNAGAVELFKNGTSVGKPGAAGDVVEKTFTR